MDGSEQCYFDLIPDEIKLIILSYLNSREIVNLSTIPSFEHLTYEKRFINKLSFYKANCFDIKFVTNVHRKQFITSLNITGVYWVSPHKLCDAIGKLVNLQELYAIGTQLGFNGKTTKIFKLLSRLTSLGLTLHKSESIIKKNFPSQISNLYLHCTSFYMIDITLNSLNDFTNLRELWIIEHSFDSEVEHTITYNIVPKDLRKFVHCIYPYVSNISLYGYVLNKRITFKGCIEGQMMLEKEEEGRKEIFLQCDVDDDVWSSYFKSPYRSPFCLKDAKKLLCGTISLTEFEFTEINFKHSKTENCDISYSQVKEILLRENMKNLKKLSINFCICRQSYTRSEPSTSHINKKRRLGIPRLLPTKSAFEEIVENCTRLEELEIWGCKTSGSYVVTQNSLICIKNLKNLKKLSLEKFPININGAILTQICSNLPNLVSLRIHSSQQHSTLTYGICQCLKSMPLLKDLRYEQPHISLDRLFDYLSETNCLKLDRLVLNCKSSEFTKSNESLEKFLKNNRQLRFFCLTLNNAVNIWTITKIVKKYKTSWHAYFVQNRANDNDLESFPIDNWEIVRNLTAISILDPFNGYVQ